jgi:HK97 family phage portal protein
VNLVKLWGSQVETAFRAFTMRWSGSPRHWFGGGYGSTRRSYQSLAKPDTNSIVIACIGAVRRAFPEAPSIVQVRSGDEWEADPEHALQALLDYPNPYYSGVHLWEATVSDYLASGNAYWVKVRSRARRVVELWYVPSWMIEPAWPDDGSEFISHYEYRPNEDIIGLERSDVVHFRKGVDPRNTRKGLSDLAALYREIVTDDEAANFQVSLLMNLGIPGVVVSPTEVVSEEEAERVKAMMIEKFSGDKRGEPLVMEGPTTVSVLSFNPEQMQMEGTRRVPEERVSAVFGTPAVIVGLGAGLERSTYNNMSEAREHFYEGLIIPMQRLMRADLQLQLVPDFGDRASLRVEFDYSQVRVLQEDQDKLHTRLLGDLGGGMVKLNEARLAAGYDAIDGEMGDLIYVPGTVTPTPVDKLWEEPPEPVAPAPGAEPGEQPPEGEEGPPEELPRAAGRRNGRHKATVDGVEQKGLDDILGSLVRLFDDSVPTWKGRLSIFLSAQQSRIMGRVATTRDTGLVVPTEESELLARSLRPLQGATLDRVSGTVGRNLGVETPIGPQVREDYLRRAGANIAGITDATRDAVRGAIAESLANGESVAQLRERIMGMTEFSFARAETIARTELATALNLAAVESYRQSGVVVGVRVTDGDYDPACTAMNGRTFRLGEEPRPLEHPNCRRIFAPIVDATTLA